MNARVGKRVGGDGRIESRRRARWCNESEWPLVDAPGRAAKAWMGSGGGDGSRPKRVHG